MSRIRSMGCPECGCPRTQVVNTTPDASGRYKQIQRVKCHGCNHRWYAAIPHPVVIPYVTYVGHGKYQRCSVPAGE